MLDSLYAKDWYGNQDLKPRSTRHTQTVTVKKGRDHGILYENQMMGVPRLRQVTKALSLLLKYRNRFFH